MSVYVFVYVCKCIHIYTHTYIHTCMVPASKSPSKLQQQQCCNIQLNYLIFLQRNFVACPQMILALKSVWAIGCQECFEACLFDCMATSLCIRGMQCPKGSFCTELPRLSSLPLCTTT